MAVLSSCDVFKSLSDAATISFVSAPKAASKRSPQSVASIRGPCEPQRIIGAKQRADAKLTLSRRDIMFTSLSVMGIMLLPKSSSAVEVDDKDFREKLLEQINNLQQLVSKSLGDATDAVTTKAEEAMSSLKFGNDKAVENLTEIKSSTVETVQKDKLAQN